MSLTRVLCFLLVASTAQAQETAQSRTWTVPLTNDFEVNGLGTDDAWGKTGWTSLPARQGARSRYSTQAKLLYSVTGVYCLFSCQDNQITATLKEDFSNLFREDVVEIFFWPDETIPVYFEYELSPYGYELAIVVPNIEGKFYGWRPWHYDGDRVTRRKATITKSANGVEAWIAEFFIPYSLLKPLVMTPPQKGSHWRVNLYRIDYDEGSSQWSWQLTKKNFHDYQSFGVMEFR